MLKKYERKKTPKYISKRKLTIYREKSLKSGYFLEKDLFFAVDFFYCLLMAIFSAFSCYIVVVAVVFVVVIIVVYIVIFLGVKAGELRFISLSQQIYINCCRNHIADS